MIALLTTAPANSSLYSVLSCPRGMVSPKDAMIAESSTLVVLPGVGSFGSATGYIRSMIGRRTDRPRLMGLALWAFVWVRIYFSERIRGKSKRC